MLGIWTPPHLHKDPVQYGTAHPLLRSNVGSERLSYSAKDTQHLRGGWGISATAPSDKASVREVIELCVRGWSFPLHSSLKSS